MSKTTTKHQDGGQLERVESYQWPAGHIGHLGEAQRDALDRFKKLCEEKGYYTPATEESEASHDDETLLRYLRARKWIPQDAFGQLKGTEDWRSENQLDTLYETIDVDDYEQTRRLYPQWTGRRDKRGMPLYVYEIATVDAKDVTAYASDKDSKQAKSSSNKTPWKMMRLFALYENLCRFVMPLCSALPDRQNLESPISQSNNIVDISKVSMAKFWSLRNHMGDASKLASAHYPETLDRIFVIGAPSYFPTVWEWAKRWFDPITVSKIFILSDKNMLETLSKYIDVESIPKKYGGQLDWRFGDMPYLEPAIADRLQWKEDIMEKGHRTLPKGPIRWQYDKDGGLVATAIGTEDGKPRQRVIAGLPKPEVGVTRLALSPGRAHTTTSSSKPSHINAEKGAAAPQTQANGAPPPPQPGNMQTDANLNIGKGPDAASPGSSRAGTYTVPYRDERNDVASPPVDSRQGTSHTRFEQQSNTHAEDQLAHGTPEYRVDSQGEKQGVMEPGTVGQAPKEHPMPDPEGDKQPSVVEQAQAYATQASEQVQAVSQSVLAAVGLGGKKEETPAEQEVKKEDPEIDGMPGKNIEEFLRHQTMSQPQPSGK